MLAVLLVGGGSAAVAQERGAGQDSVTVDQAVRLALDDNPALRAARQRTKAATAGERAARSAWFPEVGGSVQYRRLSENVDYTVDLPSGMGEQPVTFAPAILNRYAARATVEQVLFTGLRRPNKIEAAEVHTRAAEARSDGTAQDLAFRTRAAYWRLYEAQAQFASARRAFRQMERQLRDVQNEQEAGTATEADVLGVRARRDRIRVQRIQAGNEVQAARRTLNDRMGRPLDAPLTLTDTVTVVPAPTDTTRLVQRAQSHRPDLQALRHTVQARGAEVGIARAEWWPQVAISGSYLYARPNEQLFPPEDQFEGSWEVGVRLSWNLSLGGRADAATDQAQAQRAAARYDLQDRRRAVRVEVRTQAERVAQTRQAIRAAQTSLQSAQAAYRSLQSRFEEGMIVVSDLLDAERALREARAQLAQAQAEYATARAALARAVGRDVDVSPRP